MDVRELTPPQRRSPAQSPLCLSWTFLMILEHSSPRCSSSAAKAIDAVVKVVVKDLEKEGIF